MRKLILILLFVGAAGFAFSPYYTTGKFRDALNSGETKDIEDLVDWPALRTSIKEQLHARFEKVLQQKNGGGATLSAFQSSSINTVVDQMLENKNMKFTAENFARDAKVPLGKTAPVEAVTIESRSWKSPTEFTMRTNTEPGTLKFHLQGVAGWKLTAIEYEEKDFDEAMKMAFAPPPGNPGTPSAPGAPAAAAATGGFPFPTGEQPKKESWLKDYKSPLDQKPSEHRGGVPGGGLGPAGPGGGKR